MTTPLPDAAPTGPWTGPLAAAAQPLVTQPLTTQPLATHSAVTAIPFFIPTFVVVAVIAVIIWRDRRTPDDAGDTGGTADPGDTGGTAPGEDRSREGGDPDRSALP